MSRRVVRGWRYFLCDECFMIWKESCRNHETPSSSPCPDESCKSRLTGGFSPFDGVPDETLPTDGRGNLGEASKTIILVNQRYA